MESEFYNFFDIATALFVLILIITHASYRKNKHMGEEHYSYFLPSLYFKTFLGLTFAFFYIGYYKGGGDTAAYWRGTVKLNDLFFHSPSGYFSELFRREEVALTSGSFNEIIGYPPSWIYSDKESWLVCKLLSVLMIFTVKGYLAVTVIIIYIAHAACWKVYELILKSGLFTSRTLAIAIFYIPSVNFWCSGISKDTILFSGMMLFTYQFFALLSNPRKTSGYIMILLLSALLYNIRSIMFMTVALPMFAVITRKVLNNKNVSWVMRSLFRFLSYGALIFIIAFIFSNGEILKSESIDNLVNQAAVVQQDFTNNQIYGDNKYDLGITDYTVTGMLVSLPSAIVAGLYRPFVWEALSPSLIFNGIESVFLIFMTLRFLFMENLKERFLSIFRHEFLVYFIISVLFIAFFAGYTSVLFGVLVRIRSFALPFFVLLLFNNPDRQDNSSITEEVS